MYLHRQIYDIVGKKLLISFRQPNYKYFVGRLLNVSVYLPSSAQLMIFVKFPNIPKTWLVKTKMSVMILKKVQDPCSQDPVFYKLWHYALEIHIKPSNFKSLARLSTSLSIEMFRLIKDLFRFKTYMETKIRPSTKKT